MMTNISANLKLSSGNEIMDGQTEWLPTSSDAGTLKTWWKYYGLQLQEE
jgi:hypothetical protein